MENWIWNSSSILVNSKRYVKLTEQISEIMIRGKPSDKTASLEDIEQLIKQAMKLSDSSFVIICQKCVSIDKVGDKKLMRTKQKLTIELLFQFYLAWKKLNVTIDIDASV